MGEGLRLVVRAQMTSEDWVVAMEGLSQQHP